VKKVSLILLFLTVSLLLGVLLRAANNSKKSLPVKKLKETVTSVEIKSDAKFVPDVILL
jgi:hypothetical protein